MAAKDPEKVRSKVQKVCRKFAGKVGWEVQTDTGGFVYSPHKFYLHPKVNSLHGPERMVRVEVDDYEEMLEVELVNPLQGRTLGKVRIPFSDFTEEKLRAELERLHRSPYPEEAQEEEFPDTLDIGWYYSEKEDDFRMAKIAQKDRTSHLYVIGATGTGKTKFLEFLIQQDIEMGKGFGVIDPHGDLIEDVKGFLGYYYGEDEEISRRVVLVDPTDPEFTVTFNPLEKLPGVSPAEQAGELLSCFRKIWSGSWGVRMEDLMRNSLIALAEAELPLTELPHLLTDGNFRMRVLDRVENPIARDYFRRFDSLTERGRVAWIEPVMNKMNALLADQRIAQIFSSPKSSFDLRNVMDEGKILLVKLDKGKLKDSADLLGSLIMAKVQMAAFSRSDVPQSRRRPFYLYIDEFQNFATESFLVVLSEARKYGLCLIMAHQTLSQIPSELREAILGNAGVQVYFRLNRHDAQILAKEAFEYSGYEVKAVSGLHPVFWTLGEEWERKTEELQNLPPRCCYVKHKLEGGMIPIFTAEVEPAWKVLGMEEDEYLEYLRNLPIGRDYLVPRKELLPPRYVPPLKEERPEVETKVREEPPPPRKVPSEPKLQRQHRYLQSLIKRMAEERGYRAVIEEPTPDGGRVDVGLEGDGKRIACEISITSQSEQEISNIEKCLRAGYDLVILCSPERSSLERIKKAALERIGEGRERVLFLLPEELFSYLEREEVPSKEDRVKGYRVKVKYQPLGEEERKARREAIARVIVQALGRLKQRKSELAPWKA